MTIISPSEPSKPACTDCKTRGHYCPGVVSFGNGETWLCFACDAGEPCAHVKAERTPEVERSKAEQVDQVHQREEQRRGRAGLRAARIIKAKEPKVRQMGIAKAAQSLREKYDRDEAGPEPVPQQAAEPDLPPAAAPLASDVRFVTKGEVAAASLAAASTVIFELCQERARLAEQMRDLDFFIEYLEKVRARWAQVGA